MLAWQARQTLTQIRAQGPADESLLYLPPAERLGPLSLGYKEALADLIWLRAVIFAGTGKQGEKIDWLRRYVNTINHLAPTFRQPYQWGSVVTIYSGRDIDQSMIDQSVQILKDGLSHFPEDHEMLFTLGMILFRDYESLGTLDQDTVAQYKREGAHYIRKAAAFGASPLIRKLAASIEQEGSDDALQVEFLKDQLLRAQDEELKRLLKHKLAQLESKVDLAAIEKAQTDFIAAHQADFPYVSPDLFALLQKPADDYN